MDWSRTLFQLNVTRRGAVLLAIVFGLLLLSALTRAEDYVKEIDIEAEIIGANVLRIEVEGHAYYASCNSTCGFEDVEVEYECNSTESYSCGLNVTSALWDLRQLTLESRDSIMTGIARNNSGCDTSRLQEVPTTPQMEAMFSSSRSSLEEWLTRDAMPQVADYNKLKADLESANTRLVEAEKTNEVQRVLFMNATDEKDVVIEELRKDKGSVNSRYDGALLVILALVAYTSGALSFVIDKVRGAS